MFASVRLRSPQRLLLLRELCLQTGEELRRQLLGGPLEQARANAGNGAADYHVGLPVHARLRPVEIDKFHIASQIHGAAGRLAAPLDNHVIGLLHLGAGDIEGKLRLHRPHPGAHHGLPVLLAQHLQTLEARRAGRDLVDIEQIVPDLLDRGIDRLGTDKLHIQCHLSCCTKYS